MRRLKRLLRPLCAGTIIMVVVAPVTAGGGEPTGDTVIAYDLDTGEQRWRRDLAPGWYLQAATTDDQRIYAESVNCEAYPGAYVVALDGRTGERLWRSKASLSFGEFQRGVGEGTVVATRPGYSGMQALATKTGEKRWEVRSPEATVPPFPPHFADTPTVVLAIPQTQPFDTTGQPRYGAAYDIEALDRRTGKPAWIFTAAPAPGEYIFTFNFLAADDRVVVLEQVVASLVPAPMPWTSDVIVLDAETGLERSRVRRAGGIGANVHLVQASLVYADETGVFGLDLESGETRWELDGRWDIAATSNPDRAVYLMDIAGTTPTAITTLDARTGSQQWTTPPMDARFADADRGVVMLTTPEGMLALEAATGAVRWRAPYPKDVDAALGDKSNPTPGLGFGSVLGFGPGAVFVNASFDCA